MIELPLYIFTESEDFPFYIQYGFHEKECHMHGHLDFSELVIVLEGTASHIVENETYTISKGDIFVIDRYTHHSYMNAENFRICNIMFRPEHIFRNVDHIRQNAGFQALFVLEPYYTQNHQFCSRLHLNAEDYGQIHNSIEQIMDEYTRRPDGWQTLVYAKFILLCVTLSRLYQKKKTESKKDILSLASAAAYIEKNFCNEISIAQLAQITGYSQRQFTRLFKQAYSTTPNLYIIHLRIQKARHLLLETELSIGEIAWKCGFPDQNYFSRVFRGTTGLTPSQFRSK